MKRCNKMQLMLQIKLLIDITLKGTSLPTLRKNSTRNTPQHGIVLLEEVSDHILLMKVNILFIFMLDSWLYFYLKVVD